MISSALPTPAFLKMLLRAPLGWLGLTPAPTPQIVGVSLPLGVSDAPPSPGPASIYVLLYIGAAAATCSIRDVGVTHTRCSKLGKTRTQPEPRAEQLHNQPTDAEERASRGVICNVTQKNPNVFTVSDKRRTQTPLSQIHSSPERPSVGRNPTLSPPWPSQGHFIRQPFFRIALYNWKIVFAIIQYDEQ